MAAARDKLHGHDIIVMGASAGGFEVVLRITRALPADLRAAVFIVLHSSGGTPGVLPRLINHGSPLYAAYAEDGEPIVEGRIYLPPPDHHLLIKPLQVAVRRGPKENGFRPAVDPLFRTAARSYGARVVGVILSGALDDGTHGLWLIKAFGGKAIVQDPHEAFTPGMPTSACRNVSVDYVVASNEIAPLLGYLSREAPNGVPNIGGNGMDPDDQREPDIAERGSDALREHLYPGPPSTFTCPECGGTLWEVSSGQPVRFRCHVGHSFTGEGLLAEQSHGLENALWTAVRALDESAELSRRMADRAGQGNLEGLEEAYRKRGETAQKQANVIRDLLVSKASGSLESDAATAVDATIGGAGPATRHVPRKLK